MTSATSADAKRSRVLRWAGAACIAGAWIAEIIAATMGPVPWPGWVMLVSVTGMMASHLLFPARARAGVVLIVAMAILSVISVIGTIAARAH